MSWPTVMLWYLGLHIGASLLVLTQVTKSNEAFIRGSILALEVGLFTWGVLA